jgi:2-iminoacetate synthase
MSFLSYLETLNRDSLVSESLMARSKDVDYVLQKKTIELSDFQILLSPAAEAYLEPMAKRAHAITVQRFGRTIQFFVPMYLSNECFNTCTYCGFSMENKYKRKTLNNEEIHNEFRALADKGFEHVLLLTGESPKKVGTDYIADAVSIARQYFSSVGIEVQPMNQEEYAQVIQSGADSLTLYQETYNKNDYSKYHLFGMKKNYDHRLLAVEEGAKAGFYKIQIGALLGLSDWRYDMISLAHHVSYMRRHYWQSKYGVSFPRTNGMFGEFKIDFPVSDKNLVQIMLAFRLVFHDLSITMSTREPGNLRDQLLPLGVTTMSAESNTSPGGYTMNTEEGQFDISDDRSLAELRQVLSTQGYEMVMKDWDSFILPSNKA